MNVAEVDPSLDRAWCQLCGLFEESEGCAVVLLLQVHLSACDEVRDAVRRVQLAHGNKPPCRSTDGKWRHDTVWPGQDRLRSLPMAMLPAAVYNSDHTSL